jgi:hypothetical protein
MSLPLKIFDKLPQPKDRHLPATGSHVSRIQHSGFGSG